VFTTWKRAWNGARLEITRGLNETLSMIS